MIEQLLKYETSLLIKETRENKNFLSEVLNDSFHYINLNGQLFNKTEYLKMEEEFNDIVFPLENLNVKEVNESVVIITYSLRRKNNDSSTVTFVTSVWCFNNNTFSIISKQETNVLWVNNNV